MNGGFEHKRTKGTKKKLVRHESLVAFVSFCENSLRAVRRPAFRKTKRLQERELRGVGKSDRRETHSDSEQPDAFAGAGKSFRQQSAIFA